MAKSKNRSYLSDGRDLSNIPSELDSLPRLNGLTGYPTRNTSRVVDARRFTFETVPPITRTLAGRPARVIATPPAKQGRYKLKQSQQRPSWQALSFQAPRHVVECVRRGIRSEVLHAIGVAGKRGIKGKGGTYNRRPSSQIRC